MLTLRTTGTIGASLVLLVAVLAAGAGAGVASLLGGGDSAPSATATSEIPAAMLTLYEQAAASCPGLPWSVLAAIGQVESDQGRDDATSSAGAEGPMQFLPSTFAEYDEPVPPGGANPPSPDDPTDAIYAAARDLCANGARDGADLSAAVFDYNHSESYVAEVLDLANSYGETAAEAVATGTAGGIARRLGARPGRHALRLGRRDARRRLRLLRARPGRLRGCRRQPAPRRPGPVRRRTPAPTGRSARARRPRLLRRRPG